MRILVVDDEEMIRGLAAKVLGRAKVEAVLAESAAEGLAKCIEDPTIEIAIVDMTLPDMEGLDLIREIKKHRADIRFILSTGRALTEGDLPAELVGSVKLLPKPYRSQALLDMVGVTADQTGRIPQSSR